MGTIESFREKMPQRVRPEGRAEVENQNVYGKGGFAAREAIHNVAQGRTVGSADELEFDE